MEQQKNESTPDCTETKKNTATTGHNLTENETLRESERYFLPHSLWAAVHRRPCDFQQSLRTALAQPANVK